MVVSLGVFSVIMSWLSFMFLCWISLVLCL